MYKRIASLSLAAMAFLMWFRVVSPDLAKVLCARDGTGCIVEYSVVRQDRLGNDVTLRFNTDEQEKFCDVAGL